MRPGVPPASTQTCSAGQGSRAPAADLCPGGLTTPVDQRAAPAAGVGAPALARRAPIRIRPSADPSISSLARSGWGIIPTTFPAALQTPAMSPTDPFGLYT